MYEKNIYHVSKYYKENYWKKKIGNQISLSDTAVFFENTFSESGAFTAPRCCSPVARAHFSGVIYEFHETTEHRLCISS